MDLERIGTTSFQFIADERLRDAIERDKKELDDCLEHELCKSTLLLAGSIIEAVLIDFFRAFPLPDLSPQKLLDANLGTLLARAEEEKLISSRTKELSTVIKNYRNLIHPGREYRLREKIDIHNARVAKSLVEIIIEEVAENYSKRRGYTMEQAIHKISIDPSFVSVSSHVIDKMAQVERVKLFKAIPDLCDESDFTGEVVKSFIKLHELLKGEVSKEILVSEVTKVYDAINNKTKSEALFYFRFFMGDLSVLPDEQKNAIIMYILSCLEHSTELELLVYRQWKTFNFIGKELNNEDGIAQLISVIDRKLYAEENKVFGSIICSVIAFDIDREYRKYVIEALLQEDWNETALKWAKEFENPMPF